AIEPLPPLALTSVGQLPDSTALPFEPVETIARGPSQSRYETCATNAAGVASVTLEVVTMPVPSRAPAASSMIVGTSRSAPAVVAMRPALVTIPVANDVA